MINKTIFKGLRELHLSKAAPVTLFFLLQGFLADAQQTNNATPQEAFPYTEVIGSAVAIIGLILIAWWIGSRQSKPDDHPEIHMPTRRHFDHPNDPHFRKVKRKTS